MAEHKVILPSMGEGVMEATVTGWLKQVGDKIEEDESIVEIATDKVDSDVPATASGILKEILVQVDQVAKVGEAIAIIKTEDSSQESSSPSENSKEISTEVEEEVAEAAKEMEAAIQSKKTTHTFASQEDGQFLSPLVRSMAKEENISAEELKNISGSGLNGRITKADIQNYLENRSKTSEKSIQNTTNQVTNQQAQATAQPVIAESNEEIIQMDRMRKIIAEHMLASKQTSPHVSSFVETDMTNVVLWRNKIKKEFQQREGEKITFMPIIIQAIVKAIKDFPMINISVNGDQIIKKNNINIGIAAARPDGNLIVPVIKNADQFSLVGLTKKINDLAYRAKNNQLKPDEIKGGTYTVSNIGSFGNILGTPIINQPEVAIMAVGAIEKKPAVIETPQGDLIGIRHKMYLSHSYDHRVVDGALGGMFVKRVSDYLENFDINQEI
ncbi:Dihydrolipoyllysine-residue acetyltransferase component of pyruvate dehydrogenase complex [Candidatus Ornithobacterium hominis]|uniref:Dihydrolipoamide acetyltransferase component of pyruvate dehydrogenase complex n=1 Tax=Candidatus Ornithobacterium hominis TaxID=2497989 RepID=A0A383TZU2_9FLAO|nr:dihydrolipoamide acetyltransferase family protein [Candidatus Ornithobacterium hominis]MCT7904167.1 2-oxo acid dehydrogenase subunit E2 [Candidatus Ornithobacterium hominis]SZD72293.1 Dihydrolipoyllysine-residue acetyltransferase component of pyruvate dehydrogenase complex [Candidatus Ornithobacterium hominis]